MRLASFLMIVRKGSADAWCELEPRRHLSRSADSFLPLALIDLSNNIREVHARRRENEHSATFWATHMAVKSLGSVPPWLHPKIFLNNIINKELKK